MDHYIVKNLVGKYNIQIVVSDKLYEINKVSKEQVVYQMQKWEESCE